MNELSQMAEVAGSSEASMDEATVTPASAFIGRVRERAILSSAAAQVILVATTWKSTSVAAELMAAYLATLVVGICVAGLIERGVSVDTVAAMSALGALAYVLLAGHATHWAPAVWPQVAILGLACTSESRVLNRARVGIAVGLAALTSIAEGGSALSIAVFAIAATLPYAAFELALSRQLGESVGPELELAPMRVEDF